MSPNPAREVARDKPIGLDTGGVRVEPAILLLVAQYLHSWAWMDATRNRLLIALMKADYVAACEMLDVLRGPNRTTALRNVAKKVLSKERYDLLDWVLNGLRDVDTHRNAFAHHIVVVIPGMPDAVGFLDPRHLSGVVARERQGAKVANIHEPLWEAQVYAIPELVKRLHDVRAAADRVRDLEAVLVDEKRGVEGLRRLSTARQAEQERPPPSRQTKDEPPPQSPPSEPPPPP